MNLSTKRYVDNQIKWAAKVDKERHAGFVKYMEAEFRSVREAVHKVEVTNQEAVNKVEESNRQKFEAQNEWRGQFKDQMVTFLSRKEFWAVIILVVVGLILNYLKK